MCVCVASIKFTCFLYISLLFGVAHSLLICSPIQHPAVTDSYFTAYTRRVELKTLLLFTSPKVGQRAINKRCKSKNLNTAEQERKLLQRNLNKKDYCGNYKVTSLFSAVSQLAVLWVVCCETDYELGLFANRIVAKLKPGFH